MGPQDVCPEPVGPPEREFGGRGGTPTIFLLMTTGHKDIVKEPEAVGGEACVLRNQTGPGSNPSSVSTRLMRDLGQMASPLCAPVSSSVEQKLQSIPQSLIEITPH